MKKIVSNILFVILTTLPVIASALTLEECNAALKQSPAAGTCKFETYDIVSGEMYRDEFCDGDMSCPDAGSVRFWCKMKDYHMSCYKKETVGNKTVWECPDSIPYCGKAVYCGKGKLGYDNCTPVNPPF